LPIRSTRKPADQDADQSFVATILEALKTAGVQQAHKEDKVTFTAIGALGRQSDLRGWGATATAPGR